MPPSTAAHKAQAVRNGSESDENFAQRPVRDRKPSFKQQQMEELFPLVKKVKGNASSKAKSANFLEVTADVSNRGGPAGPSSRVVPVNDKQRPSTPPGRQRQHMVDPPPRSSTRAVKSTQRCRPQHINEYEHYGDLLHPGDSVYIVNSDDKNTWPADDDPEDICIVCNKGNEAPKGKAKKHAKLNELLECTRCLRATHMRCLRPEMESVPEGDWLCGSCESGHKPICQPESAVSTYLFGERGDKAPLALVRILEITRDREGDGEVDMTVQYYCLPDETAHGRDVHVHHTREVFLSSEVRLENVTTYFRHVNVVQRNALDSTPGNDVFVCDWAYDLQWKRFTRISDAAEQDSAHMPCCRLDNSDDDGGQDWQPTLDNVSDEDGFIKKEDLRDIYQRPFPGLPEQCKHKLGDPVTVSSWRRAGMLPARGRLAATARRTGANRYCGTTKVDPGPQLPGHLGVAAVPPRAPQAPLAAARRVLSLAAAPATLPCRDDEKAHLMDFVTKAVDCEASVSPGVLYICGVPGTGKTACVMEVLAANKTRALQKNVQMVMLNALQLPSPLHVYSKLWERLMGQRLGPARALAALQSVFGPERSAPRRVTTIILIDEIDMLMTKDQAILYNLFDWPMQPEARLSVIGISNTHDLDERVLPRIASRLANQKLAFQPYNKAQLLTIIQDRLRGCDVFNDMAVEFAAMKAASTTGDVRRALELLRRAADLANVSVQEAAARGQAAPTSFTKLVTHIHVMEAQKEQFSSAHMEMLRSCSLLEKLLLAGLIVQMRMDNKPDAVLSDIYRRVSAFGATVPEVRGVLSLPFMSAAASLMAKRMLNAEPLWRHLQAKVSFHVPKDDVVLALKEDDRLRPLSSQIF